MGGITVNTPNYLAYGADAEVTVGNSDVGALEEGELVVFSVEMEVVERAPLGARGPLKGASRIRRAVPILTFTVAEKTAANIAHAMTGLGSSSAASSLQYGSGTLTEYASTDYKTVVVYGFARHDTKRSRITVFNALMSQVPTVNIGDQNLVFQLVFRGHYETTALNTFPAKWELER